MNLVWRAASTGACTFAAGESVVTFWRRAGAARWFAKDEAFDAAFRERFLPFHLAAAAGRCAHWLEQPEPALGLVLLLDQFPRNAFRGSAHMYATDPLARLWSRAARAAGHMAAVELELRVFFCLPLSHSEDLADQEEAVAFNRGLGRPWLDHAEGHCDIVRRFGRFPHRNALLGRQTTPEEAQFLAEGGFSG